ncbi:MAG: hypothetical protein ABI233_03890 [Chthoniobacterales bacterium]
MAKTKRSAPEIEDKWFPIVLAILVAVAFSYSIRTTLQRYNYTFWIAEAMLNGHVGWQIHPPSWLNEMVKTQGEYYSVFPLGAVLSVLPVVLVGNLGLLGRAPENLLVSLLAGLCVYFFYLLAGLEPNSKPRRVILALFPIFGAWSWCNLGFGGAWQIALGFALLGQAAALYFTFRRRWPLLAGAFFAMAFGNRTELILTLPIFLYFWSDPPAGHHLFERDAWTKSLRGSWKSLGLFLAIPIVLGLCTAAYNYARFGSIFDFGYTHIANLEKEPWYQHGLFSLYAIPWNLFKMLFEGMEDIAVFPYLRPHPFGCSIFLSSPFLFLLFREGGGNLKRLCWYTIGVLTLVLWCHGNPGGWQYSYRYAMILLPWMFLLIAQNGPRKLAATEVSLFLVSVALNAIAVYHFLWTTKMHP